MYALSAVIFSASIADFQNSELSRRYTIVSISSSSSVAAFVGLAVAIGDNVLWAIPLTLLCFGIIFGTFVNYRLRQQQNRERMHQLLSEHPGMREKFQNHWLFAGQISRLDQQQRQAEKRRLMENGDKYIRLMSEALGRLSASPADQRAYLVKLGTSTELDELALELNDVVGLVPQMVDAGLLTRHQADLIEAVDRKLERMTNEHDPDLWHVDALVTSSEWEDVRKLAKGALRALTAFDGNTAAQHRRDTA